MHDRDHQLEPARQRIRAVYDPAQFTALGHLVADELGRHLASVQAGAGPVLNWADPHQLVEMATSSREHPAATDVRQHVQTLVREALARGINLHHPRYVGHQVPASMPVAALFDLVGSVTNQVMAIYEMGPWASAVEKSLLAAVGEQLGFAKDRFAGLVTSGGSLANLTAILTARNVTLGDAWNRGLAGRKPAPVLVAHGEAHYSVLRTAGVLGLGTERIVRVGLDAKRRMDPHRLDDTLCDLRSRGVPVIAVCAGACATPIGAFDPLNDLADVCARHEAWLHVDAAHGGAACFSRLHRGLLAGIERADSVVCDAHKMMFVPALCAMVFYKNRDHRLAAFHQDAPYLFDPTAPELVEFDSGLSNFECTKRAAAFGLWGVWSLFGRQLFADLVDVTFDLADQFYELLRAADDFTAPYRPQANIVVFRYEPPELAGCTAEEVDAFQWQLRRRVIESGDAYLVANRIDGRAILRTTLINPLTTADDLRELLEVLRRHAR